MKKKLTSKTEKQKNKSLNFISVVVHLFALTDLAQLAYVEYSHVQTDRKKKKKKFSSSTIELKLLSL